jgi:hypothetical protein
MKIRYRSLIGGLLLVPVSSVLAGTGIGPYRDVQILQSNETGITLEFKPQYSRPDSIQIGSRTYTDYNFFRCISQGREGAGHPNLKYRSFSVAVPSVTGNSVEIIGTEYEDIRNVVILPVPKLVRDGAGIDVGRVYEENAEAYRVNQLVPPSIVEFGAIGRTRSIIVGDLRVFPVQYNPASRTARRYARIVIRVNFGASAKRLGGVAEDVLLESSVINYENAKQWAPQLRHVTGTKAIINSVLASGDWYRIEVKDEGIYRLDASALTTAGINVNQIDPRTIKIYGNGGLELPQDNTVSRPVDLVENAIFISGESDGKFDSGDFILFYGKSVRGWKYDPVTKSFSHYLNHYTESNYYWLTYGGTQGKRMASLQSLNDPNPLVPQKFVGKLALEEEKVKTDVNSGLDWFGQSFDPQNPVAVFANKLDGLVTTDPVKYRFVLVSESSNYADFRLEDNGVSLGIVFIPPVDGTLYDFFARKSDVTSFQRAGNLPDSRSLVRIAYEANSSSQGWLDWMEIFYSHDFSAVNDFLSFTSPDTNAVIQYNLGNFSTSGITAFDVTDYSNARLISNASISGGGFQFETRQTSGSVSQYIAVGPNGYKTPVGIQKMGNSNLHGFADGADFVIITHSDFLAQAQRVKAYREQSGPDRLATVVVNVQDIYNEFSGGLLDPTAIRDYLKYAYENWTLKPRYLLLFGDGNYDYKNITTQLKNWVPPYETLQTLDQLNSYCTDDYYGLIVGNDPRVDLAIGRIPVQSADEARVVVDKIMAYEQSSPFDVWKNLITYVADDGPAGAGEDDGDLHTAQAEDLAEHFTPDDFEKSKIYIVEYPTVFTADGRRKPDAAKAIVDQINSGTLIINWTGHGNPEVWAHEHVFERETTIPQLVNKDRLTFVSAATCDFGRYDNPTERSSTELLLVRESGGSIGSVTPVRAGFSPNNAAFNQSFFSYLFLRNEQGKLIRLGDAVFSTKQTLYDVNSQKFHLFGDPTLRLIAPTYRASLDTINGRPTAGVDTLKALGLGRLNGSVQKLDGTPWSDYSGKALLTVYDSRKEISVPDPLWIGFTFTVPGGVIYRGESTITNGKFNPAFYVPKDISYENNQGRISVYFSNASTDGAGYTENVMFGGADSTATQDTQGPTISIYLDSRNFRTGDLVGESPLLLIDYFDEHGINTASGGIGHRLEAWIDDQPTAIDLTDFYKGKTDSYQEGSVEYRLASLADGKHEITAKAWDIYNNSSTSQTTFVVATTSDLHISNVFNYPNPFARSTTFTFQQNQSMPINVEIKIYTVAGRLVKVLRAPSITDSFVRIPWDGRDEDGDIIANGVYLYRVVAHTVDGGKSTESIGKLSVLN